MTSRDSRLLRFFHELRRRRVFRTALLYVVGAWLVMQAADVFFRPGVFPNHPNRRPTTPLTADR